MMFKKVNEHTVRCMIAEQEITEMGFEIEEICRNQERACEFIKQIIEKSIQAGCEISEQVAAVQASFLPDHRIVLSFTDHEAEEMPDKTLETLLHAFGLVNTLEAEEFASAKDLSGIQSGESGQEVEHDTESENALQRYVMEFGDFDTLESFCKTASTVPGVLYKYQGTYYFFADLTKLEDKDKKNFLITAMDYALSLKKERFESSYLEEHGEVLIKENAMDVLGNL